MGQNLPHRVSSPLGSFNTLATRNMLYMLLKSTRYLSNCHMGSSGRCRACQNTLLLEVVEREPPRKPAGNALVTERKRRWGRSHQPFVADSSRTLNPKS